MKQNSKFNIRPTLVAVAVAATAGMGPISAAYAQEQEQGETIKGIEEIVVTGIRSSLRQSADVKRNENGVVDAITAEDIGKFADANLAESLQRITGVSIDRQNNEGNQITVRGLGPNFNMVTLNGRQMPVASSPEQESISSATQSRAFNFAEIASESVTAVEVFKTARANVPTGGIGATVNIKTARPLSVGDKLVGNIKAIHDSSVEEGSSVTPEFGGLFSTVLADGKVGFLVNASYSERDFSELSTHTDGWIRDTPGDGGYEAWCSSPTSQCGNAPYVYRPITNISEIQHVSRERTNAQFVAQFAPSEDLTATLDYTLSRFERRQDRFSTGLFGTVGGNTIENTRLTPNFTVASADRIGLAADALVYENELKVENDSVGLNLDWKVNDNLNLILDAHSSSATSQPDGELNDNLVILQGPLGNNFSLNYAPGGVTIGVDASNNFRGVDQFGGGDPRPGVDEFQDPDGFSPLGLVLRNIAIENEVDQVQFGADWEFNSITVNAGVSYTDYQVETNAVSTGFQFAGLGSCNGCETAITTRFIDAPSGFNVINELPVNELVAASFPITQEGILAANPPTFFASSEESTAFYINISSDIELGGMPGKISAGVRYEDTDVSGSAFQTFPVALQVTSNTEGQVLFDPNAAPVFFTVNSGYDVFLPSFDFQIEPADDMVARFSYGQTIARPDLNALRPTTSVSDYRPGIANAASGNPDLLPYSSDNVDLSFEWYYSDSSYASIAYFYKRIEDYISTSVENDVILDVAGNPLLNPEGRFVPTLGTQAAIPVVSQPGDPIAQFATTRLLNTDTREVDGIEIAVQHMFGDSGFGIQANYTMVDSDAEYDAANLNEQALLLGLSDSANLVGFFENERLSVRIAANWRDEFLFAENQLRASNEPVFFDSYLQIDVSSSYVINDSLTAVFEVLNLTGEDQFQRGRFNDQFLFENDQKPRFAFGLRGDF